MSDTRNYDSIILGAGAAGLMAGIFAARGGRRVLVLESRPNPGAKILVSGGGRCNVLPSQLQLRDFHGSGSLNTLRNIVYSWPLKEVHRFFQEDLGVPLKVEATGKVFPRSDSAREVVSALLHALDDSGARLEGGFRVAAIDAQEPGLFTTRSESGEMRRASSLVLATGGLSLPKSGSDGAGLRFAQTLGHGLAPTYPALVPLLSSTEGWAELSGVSLRVRLSARAGDRLLEEREGDFLFTHRGFSGPVVLDMSRHLTEPGSTATLRVCWGGGGKGIWDVRLRDAGAATAGAVLKRELPDRLAKRLLALAGVGSSTKPAELARADRLRLVSTLEDFELPASGSEGYRTAEVTGGGVPLAEVDARTLQSRVRPRLYLCGEILDATGRIGGYNFLWAWVTGRKVGLGLAGSRPS